MNRFRKNEKGFTLVELLIVVAIIGILAAIAIPQFTKYKKSAAEKACVSALKTCITDLSARYSEDSTEDTLSCNIDGITEIDMVVINADGEVNGFGDDTGVAAVEIRQDAQNKTQSGYDFDVHYNNSTGIIKCDVI